MKKNDKVVITLGVVILLIAAAGIYYWVPGGDETKTPDATDLLKVSSELKMQPMAMSISDNCPFYPLIVTPVTVNYDEDGNQNIAPLFIENITDTSSAVENAKDNIGKNAENEISGLSAEEFSLHIVDKYWKSSDAALLIKGDEAGYSLGVAAVPMASYLCIPVIVTDEVDEKVKEVLRDLGVDTTIVCGDLDGFGNYVLEYEEVEDILFDTVEIIREKFKEDVEYITLTNPRDSFPPEPIGEPEILLYEKGTLQNGNVFPTNFLNSIKAELLGQKVRFTVIIPDMEYAHIELHLKNLVPVENVDLFGDDLFLRGSLTNYMRTLAYPAERDGNGDIEYDQLYYETVMYDQAGEEFSVEITPNYHVANTGEFEITVTATELSNPYYPLMPQFSSIAPYLTAYHKGIIYADGNFAFAAGENVTYKEQTMPGNTQILFNPALIPVSNQHMYEDIYVPLNEILAEITDIDITDSTEALTRYCKSNPFYIALVGDTTMMPQYYYRSPHSDPFEHSSKGAYGTNCPSDFIYGNIDPEKYSMQPYAKDHVEDDLWTDYPEVENIVGRITGYDIQDASALIARTVFYDDIIENLGDWQDNSLFLVGAGTEVQRLPFFNAIQGMLGHSDPMKFPSGEKKFLAMKIKDYMEDSGFTATTLEKGAAQRTGYSNEAIWKMKTDGILNLLLFPFWAVKFRQGFENSNSFKDPQWWIDALLGDGSEYIKGGETMENSNLIMSDSHAIWFEMEHGDILLDAIGGPRVIYELLARYLPIIPSFASPLISKGAYSVRDVETMQMGPSVMLVEGCGSGKIDSLPPKNTIANTWLHTGVNAYISPTTLSAFYGALEPRPKWPLFQDGVGLGIVGYLQAAANARKGVYPESYFNQYVFEHMVKSMADNDIDIGTALRDAKNDYLEAQADITFRWTPPLAIPASVPEDIMASYQIDDMQPTAGHDNFIVEKYCTIFQINLLGDPAFNPYEPVNEG